PEMEKDGAARTGFVSSQTPRLLTQVHKTTGTITLSFPPVNTASVKLATEAQTPAFRISTGQLRSFPSGTGHLPTLNHRLADTRPTSTAVAKAALPSRLLPPPQTHFRWPHRRPMREAAASPRPTQMTPETMLTSRVGISQPARWPEPLRGSEARVSQRGMAQPIRRKM